MGDTHVDFSKALEMMKDGKRMYRMAWEGRIAYWFIKIDKAGNENLYQTRSDGSERIIEAFLTEDILGKDWWIAI